MSSDNVITQLGEISQRLQTIEQHLRMGQSTFQFFDAALALHREQAIARAGFLKQPILEWVDVIQRDSALRFPHRKILECLLRQYDHATGTFNEIHSSKLWRESRVGKGRLWGYVQLLCAKGYVTSRSDGYRTFIGIKNSERLSHPAHQPRAPL